MYLFLRELLEIKINRLIFNKTILKGDFKCNPYPQNYLASNL